MRANVDDRGREVLAERAPGGTIEVLAEAGTGVRWPSFGGGRDLILFTTVDRRVEYWVAENPLDAPARSETAGMVTAPPMTTPDRGVAVGEVSLTRSPVDLHGR